MNLQKLEMRFQLQTKRSRNLLGVRSSDWYQTKALGLYFLFVKVFFVFRKISVSKFWKYNLILDQILDHLQSSGVTRYTYLISEKNPNTKYFFIMAKNDFQKNISKKKHKFFENRKNRKNRFF